MKIVIIGAGVFGAWAAWFLSAAQHNVTLIDAYGPANSRASSADHSRVIRSGYGADSIYSRWARASLDDWQWLARETGCELVVRSGALFMAAPGDAYVEATHQTLTAAGIRSERLNPAHVSARFPQISIDGLGAAVFEPDAGVIRARAAVQALVRLLVGERQVAYRTARLVPPDELQPQPTMRLTTGEPLAADLFICACGPWLSTLLPRSVGGRIRPTRQEVLHFGVPPADDRFAIPRLPVWIDFQAGLYGIPDLDARGFKVGIDRHGPPIDPDTDDRLIDPRVVARTREWLATRFPALANAPLVDGRVCQYENTSTGDFVIDRHPQWPSVWIIGGGSGHGFKHGPAVGRHVAALVSGEAAAESRFLLAGKGTSGQRAVY